MMARGPCVLGSTYVEVLDINVAVLGQVVVLFGDEYTLLEEVLVDRLAVGFGDKPVRVSTKSLDCLTGCLHCRESLALFGRSRTIRNVKMSGNESGCWFKKTFVGHGRCRQILGSVREVLAPSGVRFPKFPAPTNDTPRLSNTTTIITHLYDKLVHCTREH